MEANEEEMEGMIDRRHVQRLQLNSIQPPEAQGLTGMILPDMRVNVLREFGGLFAVRALILGRHPALVAQMPRHVLLQGEAAVAAWTVVTLVHGVHFAPLPGRVLADT